MAAPSYGGPEPQERFKLRTANLADTFTGSIRTKALEKFERKGTWAYSGTAAQLFEFRIISGTGT